MKLRCRLPLLICGLVSVAALSQLFAAENPLNLFGETKWAWNPGYEFPGAKGNRRIDTVDGREALVISYDFTGGGAYVIAGNRIDLAEGPSELRFDVRAEKELKIVVRLEDAEKQTHQYQLRYDTPAHWQTLTVRLKEVATKSFGGPADGVMHYPISKFWVGVGKGNTTTEPGDAAVSMIRTVE